MTAPDGAPVRSISVFFPALNEEEIITQTVEHAATFLGTAAQDWEIIVVDDGSVDGTAQRVLELVEHDPRVRLVRHDRNLGYGAALRSGFANAAKELIFFSDADGQFDISELAGMLPKLAEAPVVVGYRIKRSDAPHRLFIAKTYRLIVYLVFGLRLRDIDCAFKLFRREALSGLNLESDGAFISSELLIKLKRRAIPIVERGVHHYPRRTGYSKGANFRVIMKTIRDIVRLRLGLPLKAAASR